MPRINRNAKGDQGLNQNSFNSEHSNEYLSEISGRQGAQNFRIMSKCDPQIGMILRVHKNPILSTNFSIPYPDGLTAEEELAIDLLKKWFFEEYSICFNILLGQILSFLEYGFSCFERIWVPFEYEGNTYFMPTLEQRLQTSIENIYPDKGIIQQSTIKNGLVDIPLKDMVFFTLNQQGLDYRGESLIRNCYALWKSKNAYQEIIGLGIQRSAVGVPWMKVPKGTQVSGDDYAATEQLLQNISAHENAYMIFQEGWEFGITESKFNSETVQGAIDAIDTKMAISVLAQFLLLGSGGGSGAYALSRDHSELFLDGLQYMVTIIEDSFNRNVIIPMLEINFGGIVDPANIKLTGLNLDKKSGGELADVLQKLGASGFVKPTLDDEIQLRKFLEMPELSNEDIDQRIKVEEQSMNEDPLLNENGNVGNNNNGNGNGSRIAGNPGNNRLLKHNLKFAEKRIEERRQYLERTIKEVHDFMQSHLGMIKDKLMADIENTLTRGTIEILGLKKIEINFNRYIKGLEMKLAGIAMDGWKTAKRNAKIRNLKFSEIDPSELTDKELKQYILNEANSIVEDQTSSLKSRAILTASNGPIKGFSINQTMSNVDKAIDAFIKSGSIQMGGSLVVVGSLNFGQNKFNKQIEDQIWGYAFVAVDDDKTSDICRWYDGKTYSVSSAQLSIVTPPLHPNCRSSLEPIYKNESDEPEIDDVLAPPSIQEQQSIF